ncbi:MAG TPA: RluA family pseudouridine synthase [Puia sp.]|nr:RluA family pseudouridine synthase [Puia sp.]
MTTPSILLESDDFIALDKPAGLLSIPDRENKEPSLKNILRDRFGSIFTVHRLDRETSGIIIFAKNETAHRYLSKNFEERSVEKIYQGIVLGTPPQQKGTIDLPVMEHPARPGLMVINRRGKTSLTDYEILETIGPYSLVQFRIHTGRTHQIRIHMHALGHPIACDDLYGDGKPIFLSALKRNFKLSRSEETERPLLARLALHSQRLRFTDPRGETHTIEAPLPKDLRALLQQLRKWKS